jgi:hypothetical protein
MMADVDAFTRRYGPLIASYLTQAHAMDTDSRTQRPAAYLPSMFADNPTKCPDTITAPAHADTDRTNTVTAPPIRITETEPHGEPTILHTKIDSVIITVPCKPNSVLRCPARVLLSSSPMLLGNISSLTSSDQPIAFSPCFDNHYLDSSNSTLSHATHSIVHWMSITPCLPSIGYHLSTKHQSLFACNLLILTSSALETAICHATLPDCLVVLAPFTDVVQCLHSTPLDRTVTTPNYLNNSSPDPSITTAFFNSDQPLHGADATCPFLVPATQATWLHSLLDSVNHFPAQLGLFCLVVSIPISELSTNCSTFASAMSAALPTWQLTSAVLNSATYGDGVSALRWMSIATCPRHLEPCYQPQLPTPSTSFATAFGDFVARSFALPALPSAAYPPPPPFLTCALLIRFCLMCSCSFHQPQGHLPTS